MRFRNKNSDKTRTLLRRDDFGRYKEQVMKLTEENKHHIPGIHKRSFLGWHIDHITSIWDGFNRGIPAEIIAHPSNLRILEAHKNLKKGRGSE